MQLRVSGNLGPEALKKILTFPKGQMPRRPLVREVVCLRTPQPCMIPYASKHLPDILESGLADIKRWPTQQCLDFAGQGCLAPEAAGQMLAQITFWCTSLCSSHSGLEKEEENKEEDIIEPVWFCHSRQVLLKTFGLQSSPPKWRLREPCHYMSEVLGSPIMLVHVLSDSHLWCLCEVPKTSSGVLQEQGEGF